MTTPNNQPTPPPGMAILTDYTKPLPSGAMRGGNPWMPIPAWEVGKLPWSLVTYAIPITPTVPATGDTTTDLILCPKCNSDDTVGISDGDKPETDGLFECYKCGHQFKIGDTTNEKGGEQRQELQVATLLNSALAAIGEYLIAFNWHHDETAWDDEDAGQWIDPITHRTHDIDYAFTLQLQRQLLCK